MTDELREQLRRLDPMHPGVPVESATTQSSRTRLEQIMNSPLVDQDLPRSDVERSDGITEPTPLDGNRRRTWMTIGGIAAATVAVLGSAAVIGNTIGNDDADPVAGPPLELSLGDSSAMGMCLVFDVATLAEMSPAFAGTATSIEGDTVTLTVDRWYAGGDAATVVLQAASGMEALLDGFDFEVGEQYLITAADGAVNFCGYSGVATPELTAAFDAAFPT